MAMDLVSQQVEALVPPRSECPLKWPILMSLSFIQTKRVVDMIIAVRKMLVSKEITGSTLRSISCAIEEVRIPSGVLFSTQLRFPEGVFIVWMPHHPVINMLCELQKFCINRQSQAESWEASEIFQIIENLENYITALSMNHVCVFDRQKFEKFVATWRFEWKTLSWIYEQLP